MINRKELIKNRMSEGLSTYRNDVHKLTRVKRGDVVSGVAGSCHAWYNYPTCDNASFVAFRDVKHEMRLKRGQIFVNTCM